MNSRIEVLFPNSTQVLRSDSEQAREQEGHAAQTGMAQAQAQLRESSQVVEARRSPASVLDGARAKMV